MTEGYPHFFWNSNIFPNRKRMSLSYESKIHSFGTPSFWLGTEKARKNHQLNLWIAPACADRTKSPYVGNIVFKMERCRASGASPVFNWMRSCCCFLLHSAHKRKWPRMERRFFPGESSYFRTFSRSKERRLCKIYRGICGIYNFWRKTFAFYSVYFCFLACNVCENTI